jgi:chromosomal replication initiation ATPase DnaA
MTEQIPLYLPQPLRYATSNFMVHGGCWDVVEALRTAFQRPGFSLSVVIGARGLGKTHCSIYGADLASSLSRPAQLLDGEGCLTWIEQNPKDLALTQNGALVVDDGNKFLSMLRNSGPFVELVEKCRRTNTALVFFSECNPQELGCDDHVMSRVRSGVQTLIGHPHERELDPLLDLLARQRGIFLSPPKRAFLLKRVGRTLPELVDCLQRLDVDVAEHSPVTAFSALAQAVSAQQK